MAVDNNNAYTIVYMIIGNSGGPLVDAATARIVGDDAIFILRIVRPRISESKFQNHCAKKLVGALRNPPPLCKNSFDPNSKFRDS